MNKEIQPLPFVNRIPARLRKPIYVGLTLVGAFATAACGGQSTEAQEPNGNGQIPIGTPTPEATASPTIAPTATAAPTEAPRPTPEATPKPEPKKLSEAKFTPTTFETVQNSIRRVYQTHPDLAQITLPFRWVKEGVVTDKETLEDIETYLVPKCQSGSPSPRVSACASITRIMLDFYRLTGHEQTFQAALDTANYTLTELPQLKGQFDADILQRTGETSPSLN